VFIVTGKLPLTTPACSGFSFLALSVCLGGGNSGDFLIFEQSACEKYLTCMTLQQRIPISDY
jgi:hypothetical protein